MNSSDIIDAFPRKEKMLRVLARYNLALPFSERRLLLFFGDVTALALAGIITLWGRVLIQPEFTVELLVAGGQAMWLVPLAVLWLIVAGVNQCYDLKVANQLRAIIQGVFLTTLIVGILYLLFFFILGRSVSNVGPTLLTERSLFINPLYLLPRIVPASFLLLAAALITLWRVGYIRLSAKYPLRRKAIIVGAGKAGQTLIQTLSRQLHGYEIIGFIDDDPAKQGQVIAGLPVLGNRYQLQNIVQKKGANEIVLAITHTMHDDLFRAMMDCYERGTVIKSMSQLYEDMLSRIPVEHLGQRSLMPFWSDINMPTLYRISKRLIDILIALIGLIFLAILFPFIALAIYLNSPGPIFYSQERLGKAGKHFKIYKFRSMIPNAEQDGEAIWATENDRRITRAGKILRRTRLDELPQLLNVLKGDMSIVGPRPERPEFVAQLQEKIPFYRARLSVKPGLTGWAQIQYQYGNSIEDALIKLEYDLYYIKYRSLPLDLLITLRTIRVILMFKGT